ncbi:OstA-like protein [Fulvivirgaceae bacterium LMO-SS25]
MIKNLLLLLFLGFSLSGFAQQGSRIILEEGAAELIGAEVNGRKFNIIKGGNVRLRQDDTQMTADSVHLYRDTNSMEAFGRVRISDGDSVVIYGDYLNYEGNSGKAILRGNVQFNDMVVQLFTENLDYYRGSETAYYFEGGRLLDSVNVLTSQNGTYIMPIKQLDFYTDVVLVNPEYTLKADTLKYNTLSREAQTFGPTEIIDKEGQIIIAEEGSTYQTDLKQSQFTDGIIKTDTYELTGDIISADELRKIYKAANRVSLWSREDSILITGKFGDYYKEQGITKVYGDAIFRKISEGDTIFMRADTLTSLEFEDGKENKIIANRNVKIFNKEFQGRADSLHYRSVDSTLYFIRDPILWTNKNQLVADQMEVTFIKDKIHEARLLNNSFVSNIDTLENFNQVKGRTMTAKFLDDQMHQILVNGNGESIFFALNDTTNQMMGMNKIVCSDINVNFVDGDVVEVLFLTQPDAKFIPPHELKEPDKRLPGFEWKIDLKPTRDSIFAVTPIDSTLIKTDSLSTPKLPDSTSMDLEIIEDEKILEVEELVTEETVEESTGEEKANTETGEKKKEEETEVEKKKENTKKEEGEEEKREDNLALNLDQINLKPKPQYFNW